MIQVVQATVAHAEALAPLMRQADAEEVKASGGYSPLGALLDALKASAESWAGVLDGEVLCMWGVAPGVEDEDSTVAGGQSVGIPWLLTGRGVDSHPKAFVRLCLSQFPAIARRHPLLIQAVDNRHTRSLRWAEWMGFDVGPPECFGFEGRLFRFITYPRGAACANP